MLTSAIHFFDLLKNEVESHKVETVVEDIGPQGEKASTTSCGKLEHSYVGRCHTSMELEVEMQEKVTKTSDGWYTGLSRLMAMSKCR